MGLNRIGYFFSLFFSTGWPEYMDFSKSTSMQTIMHQSINRTKIDSSFIEIVNS